MRIEGIRRETEKLRKKIGTLPKIHRFRGRRVVRSEDWKWADWTTLPDHYILSTGGKGTPKDWYQDYLALMEKLRDPIYGNAICIWCAIYQAQRAKEAVDRDVKYHEENGGETNKDERIQEVKWRLFNERGGAN